MAGSEPTHEMSRELVNLLVRAGDSGEPVSLERMREELGVGHDDLIVMLDQLREQGMAAEVAPGEWAQAEAPAAPPATASERVGEEGRVVVNLPDAPDADEGDGVAPALWEQTVDPDVRLTRAIAEKLSDEALGQLVKAGLEDSTEGQAFLLEITP